MTTAVTVIAPFYYPADTPLAVGATASLPDSLADQMVSAGKARYQTPRTSDRTDLTADEVSLIRGVVSGDRTPVASSRDITADDNGKFLTPTGTLTLTIPAGLDPMPSFTVDCPSSGTVSIACSTTATINGAGTTLTRTRANNPVGFVVLAHESDAYGVSGA